MDLRYSRADIERGLNRLPWQNWTPTLSANSGTPTFELQVARYLDFGTPWSGSLDGGGSFALPGTVFFQLVVKILANGSASGPLRFTLPHTPSSTEESSFGIIGNGREGDLAGYQVKVYYDAGLARIARYDSTGLPVWVNNHRFFVQGSYQR